jgi:hypothetical protein
LRLSEIDWDELYARIIALTGWTWEYVGRHLTIPRLQALNKFWAQHPSGPSGMVSGWGAAPAALTTKPEYGTLEELLGCWQECGGRVG